MSKRQKIAALAVAVLLVLAAFGLYRTAKPFAVLRQGMFAQPSLPPEVVVDESPFRTAQALAQLPNSPGEQRLAQDALRLADDEVSLAFSSSLQEVRDNPPALSAEAKRIQDRLIATQNALDADTQQIAALTAADAKAAGGKKQKLDDDLDVAKSQLELHQSEVTNNKHELIRAGGDPDAVLQEQLEAHRAAIKNTATATATQPPQGHGLVSLYQEWSELHQKESQLQAAEKAAESAAASYTVKHTALKSKLDAENSPQAAQAQKPAGSSVAVNPSGTANSQSNPAAAPEDSSTLLNTIKRRASQRKISGSLALRADDQKQLATTYGDWYVLVGAKERNAIHKALISLSIILGILLIGIFFDDWLEHLLGKTALDRRQVQSLRTVIRVTLQVLAVLMILLVVLGPPSQLGTFLGLAGAGLTVALKDFIVGFLGWFVLMGKNGIRLGDWVEINGVTGEVVELGMFHTVLLETGNWTDSGHPTGRRVTFTNSFAIEGHYFNFSTSGQWLWDELQIVLPPGRDPYPIVDAIQKKVLEVTGETAKQAEKEWQGVARSKDTAHTLTAAPAINVKPVVGGVEIAVRYITRANERYQMRAQLNQAAVDLLGQDLVAPPGAEATPASPTTVPASPAPKIA
ncbi:MAG TPA: mechanosensitive ion channel domain-containing protein [Candidatus Acidoferrum sp.]|nr:mechanosensitive ion channel domain-containing protein [Candidatus Acidoferrum sp.]